MNLPYRIIGFVHVDDYELPFEFDKESFLLKCFFSTPSDAKKHLFDEFKMGYNDLKTHEWIGSSCFKGVTSEGYIIYFNASSIPANYNGYPTYHINWYYLTKDDSKQINEIRISNNEVDFFFPPANVFKQDVHWKNEDSYVIEKMSVEARKIIDYDCGQYEHNGINTVIKCSAYPTLHTKSSLPIEAKSYLYLCFDTAVDIDIAIEKVWNIICFLKYISYRQNISNPEITTFYEKDDNKTEYLGILKFNIEEIKDMDSKVNETIINYYILQEHTAEIVHLLEKNIIPLEHICLTSEKRKSYPLSRIIMILSSFEREFSNIYGNDIKRSEEFCDTKNEVIQLVNEFATNYKGKKRKYIKNFAKGIENSSSSYGDRVKFALAQCKDIMQPFLNHHYHGNYADVVEDIGESINTLRNGIAHSRLDLEIEPRHLTDIKVIEELLFVIRLNKVGVDNIVIQKGINTLFREHLRL